MRPAGVPALSPLDHLVLFQPGRRRRDMPLWWRVYRRWLRPGFVHCMVLSYDPDGDAWVVVDPLIGGIQVRALKGGSVTCADLLRQYPHTAWVVVRRRRDLFADRWRWALTCVSVTKAVIGEGGNAWTPWQLYRRLVSQGFQHGQEERA